MYLVPLDQPELGSWRSVVCKNDCSRQSPGLRDDTNSRDVVVVGARGKGSDAVS
jgi:hypothetical protein